MALNFPNNPATNTEYTFGAKTWVYNGFAWDLKTSAASPITDGVIYSKTVSTTAGSGDTAIVVDSWSTTTYRSAKYLVQVQNTVGYHSFELQVLHDGNAVDYVQYADLLLGTGDVPSSISVDVSSGEIRLLAVPQVSSGSTTKIILTATLLNNQGSEEIFPTDLNQGSGTLDLNAGSGTIDLNN